MSTTNHEISLQDAIDMTTRYRANRPSNFPVCETFDAAAISGLLATNGCAFFRIYYGMKENLEAHAILVAVNEDGEDILPSETANTFLENGDPVILEDGTRCPPDCPSHSALNDD